MPNVARALVQHGFRKSDIEKVLGLNFLRLFRATHAARMSVGARCRSSGECSSRHCLRGDGYRASLHGLPPTTGSVASVLQSPSRSGIPCRQSDSVERKLLSGVV